MTQQPSSKDEQDKITRSAKTANRNASHSMPTMMRTNKAAETQRSRQFAYRSAMLMVGAAILTLPLYFYLADQMDAWQLGTLNRIVLGFAALSLVSAWLAHRGRVDQSVGLLLGGLGFVLMAASLLLSGMGLIFGFAFPLFAIIVTSQTLKGSRRTWMNVFGITAGLTFVLAGLFWTRSQITVPEIQLAIPALAVVLIAVLSFTLVRQFPTLPLRVKLVVILVAVALFSIAAVAFTVNRVISTEIQQQMGISLTALTKGKALEVGAMLNRDKNNLETLALNRTVQERIKTANASVINDATEFALLDEQWKTAADTADPLLDQVLNNPAAKELQRYQKRFPEFAEVFLTDRFGAIIASTNRTSDYYQADEAWWKAAWNDGAGSLYISMPEFDDNTGLYAIDLALPVFGDNSSAPIGVLRATVDVTPLKAIMRAGRFGQTGSVDLIFPDKYFLTDEAGKTLLMLDAGTAAQLSEIRESSRPMMYEDMPSLVSKSLVTASFANDRQQIESLDWYVVVHQDQREALGTVQSTTRTTTLIALAVILIAGLSAIYIGRLLTLPLTQLTAVAAQVAEGDLTVQAPVTTQDEIGILATTFNSMTGQLHTLLSSLEERVAARTRDLELASEVGRTISEKVADLQVLLTEAVELIRDRFDLSYAQIYLAEPDGRTLKLRAGTGEVGRTLLQRGHHLLIGSGSINGRAASGKQAVIIDDVAQSPTFLPNPLLPRTQSEMAVPLIAGGHVVGVLDLQSEHTGALSEAELSAFEALAGQLAIAIQNATLFSEAQQSKREVETQARRLTRTGWQDFLDAVERSEELGYAFHQDQLMPLESAGLACDGSAVTVPILITGEQLGTLQVVSGPDRAPSIDTTEIVRSTAHVLASQIENLRLLAQAERYRTKAEQIAHRLTREGWESYLTTRQALADGYVYDSNKVLAFSCNGNGHHPVVYSRPVAVRQEVIGELAIGEVDEKDEGAEQIVAVVAQQLSDHIENLRLLEEAEQRRIEIQEGEARLAEALSLAKLGHWEYDPAADLFTFNDHFYSILHTTAQQEGGYTMTSTEYTGRFVPQEDIPVVGAEIGKALTTTERLYHAKLESRVLYRGGGTGYITVSVNVERDENGRIIRFYGANQDITERKKAEEVIRLAHQRAQIILESVTLPMVITRLRDNHLTFVNRPALEVTHFEYDQVIDQPTPDFYYNPEDRAKFIAELRARGLVSNMVVQLRRESGEPFWALLSARVFDYQGEPSILTTFADITDRIQAQESLAKRAAELQTVAQVSTTTATTLDPDRLLQAVVDQTKEQFGLYHAHIYLADEDWKTLILAAGAGSLGQKLVAEGHAIPMNLEQSLVARAGRERKAVIVNDVHNEPGFLPNPLLPDTCAEMAVPMVVGDRLLGVFDVQSSTTGFTEEDANIYITLASQVGVALQNARLYVEQSATVTQLRELDRLKSSFLANMSHELRTPLNSILGFADVMLEELDGPLTENMDIDLRLIQKNGQHLLHLINDVLDMAKIEAGRMNLNPEKFRLHEVLDEVTSITSTLASEKNLCLYIEECSDREVEVYADHTRLRQVMINLVNNAIKFTERGKISLRLESIEGTRVLITVKDSGIGIPADKLEAVFQEFTQVDTSSTRKAGGTGLGLPISRRLVEMHGGRLWVESTGINGEGSVFFVELPVEARITEAVEKLAK